MPEARKDLFLVTKDHPRTPAQLIEQLDQRLAALQDRLRRPDLPPCPGRPQLRNRGAMAQSQEFKEAAEAIRKSGKAKFVGFSTHHPATARAPPGRRGRRVRRRDHAPEQSLDRPGRRHEPRPRRLLQSGHRADLDEASRRQHEPRRDRPAAPRTRGQGPDALPGPAARDLDRRAVLLVLRLDAEYRPDPRERRGGATSTR